MNRTLTSRERVLLLILAVLLLCCGYYLFVQQPVSEAMSTAQADYDDAQDSLLIETTKAAQLQKMRTILAQQSATTSRIADYDNSQNVVRVLNQALSSAQTYDLIFTPPVIEEHIATRVIDMTFTCSSYQAARTIIQTLHNSPYRCTITVMDLTQAEGNDTGSLTQGGVSARVSITFYEYVAETN